MKFSIVIFLTISSLFFIQPTQSTIPIPGLIEHVCRLTPHYHLCVLTLKSHAFARKITSNADVAAFAKITLEVIVKKIPVILATLHKVHEQCEQPEFKLALEGCINSYTKISLDILPKALGCVDKGDLEGIKQHALNTANLVASCQKKCNAFTASSLSAFANAGSTKTGSSSTGSTKTGSSSAGSINTGGSSSAGGSINTGSSSAGSINTGSSAAGSINTGSASAGSSKSGSSSAGSTNTGSGSASAGSTNTGSGSASAGSTNTGSGSASGSTNTGSSSGSTNTGSASAVKPAVKAAAKAVGDSNVYVQNMCAITVSIVTKVSASKQTTLS